TDKSALSTTLPHARNLPAVSPFSSTQVGAAYLPEELRCVSSALRRPLLACSASRGAWASASARKATRRGWRMGHHGRQRLGAEGRALTSSGGISLASPTPWGRSLAAYARLEPKLRGRWSTSAGRLAMTTGPLSFSTAGTMPYPEGRGLNIF